MPVMDGEGENLVYGLEIDSYLSIYLSLRDCRHLIFAPKLVRQ